MKIKISVIMFSILFGTNIFGQNLKRLTGAINTPVYSSCVDSLGNLYTLQNDLNKTAVYKFDVISEKWTFYQSLDSMYYDKPINTSCVFLNGNLIVLARSAYVGDALLVASIPWGGGKVNYIHYLNLNPFLSWFSEVKMTRNKNEVFIYGDFISSSQFQSCNILSYNGSKFKNINIPHLFSQNYFTSYIDTMRYVYNGSIYSIVDTSAVLYKNGGVGSSIVGLDTSLYFVAATNVNKMSPLHKTANVNIVNWNRIELKKGSNRVFVSSKVNNGYVRLGSFDNDFQFTEHFRNQISDSIPFEIVSSANKDYIYFFKGLKVNGINYGYIAELLTNSLDVVHLDTTLVITYRDKNKNNKFDLGDTITQAMIREIHTNNLQNTNSIGAHTFYSYDNENVSVEVLNELPSQSCFNQPYSGGVNSLASFNSKTKDTLYLPLWFNETDTNNYEFLKYYSKQARIEANVKFKIELVNKNCNKLSDSIELSVKIQDSTIVQSVTPSPRSVNGNVYSFKVLPSSANNQSIEFEVKYPFQSFKLNDKIKHELSFNSGTRTEQDSVVQTLVYSYDPNLKTSEPEGRITHDLKKIKFYIQFQNEGNADAYRVRVVDTLNLKMPVYQFKMVGASHPYKLMHSNNIVTWIFDDIYLKPKSVNEEGSKGNLIFEAYVNGGLGVGDSIMNRASIYFDLNEPISTNSSIVKRVLEENDSNISIFQPKYESNISVFPNPGQQTFAIENKLNRSQAVVIYNLYGQVLMEFSIMNGESKIVDTENWGSGIYYIVDENFNTIKWIKL